MDRREIIEKTAAYVREKLEGEGSGHDWWHVFRVWKLAVNIGKAEQAELYPVELAALLHDIADWKFHGGDGEVGPATAGVWLRSLEVEEAVVIHVMDIIRHVSFKGAGVETAMSTREGMVVQDADRLDAIGAVGIARTFAYGGFKGRELYNPEVPPTSHQTFEQYKNSQGPTINHFYEKLLLLKDRMNTPAARSMAEGRHRFMETFLEQFYREWEGEC